MHRTSIALAAAALIALHASAAQAQSNVSLSGWLDIGVMKKTGGAWTLGNVGRSNLAFSGSEDLGDGMAATFRLSTRFDLDTGATENAGAGAAVAKPYWKDESTIGLKGKFGSIKFGRALTPLWAQAWNFDPWYNFDRIGSLQWWQFAPDYLSDPQSRDYARINDGIFYDSPKMGGFAVHLATNIDKAATDLARNTSASFNYDQGPVSLMLGLERNSQKDKVAYFGAAWTIGAVRLMGGYSHVELNPAGLVYSGAWTDWVSASKPTTKRSSANLAATYTQGQHTYRLGIGRDFEGATSYFNYIGSTFSQAGTGYSGPIDMASAGYAYAFSKRTGLFADLAYSRWQYADDNGRKAALGYALGMSHSF